MTWLTFLMVAVVVALMAALFWAQPKGGRNVAGTRMMAVARVILVVGLLIAGWLMLR